MIKKVTYNIDEVYPYINWTFFFYTWGMNGKAENEKKKLIDDANSLLESIKKTYQTHAIFGIFDANSDGDDLIINGVRIPMLRQQTLKKDGEANLCLADFVRPVASGLSDKVGVFAASVDIGMVQDNKDDCYIQMLSQVLSDRLVEATAEKVHQDIRKTYWRYAANEDLTIQELFKGHYQGIRAAVGYPSIPDTSVNFILSDLIGMKEIGIQLTDTGMMIPHSSVSGLMFAHPQSKYFDVGAIGEDQLVDYAKRRGLQADTLRKYLYPNLTKR